MASSSPPSTLGRNGSSPHLGVSQSRESLLSLNHAAGGGGGGAGDDDESPSRPTSARGRIVAVRDLTAQLDERMARAEQSNKADLSKLGLDALPPALFKLPFLTELNVADNNLLQLPHDIRRLKCLKRLDLTNNRLETLPAELADLRNLTELRLALNPLTQLADVNERRREGIPSFLRFIKNAPRDVNWVRPRLASSGSSGSMSDGESPSSSPSSSTHSRTGSYIRVDRSPRSPHSPHITATSSAQPLDSPVASDSHISALTSHGSNPSVDVVATAARRVAELEAAAATHAAETERLRTELAERNESTTLLYTKLGSALQELRDRNKSLKTLYARYNEAERERKAFKNTCEALQRQLADAPLSPSSPPSSSSPSSQPFAARSSTSSSTSGSAPSSSNANAQLRLRNASAPSSSKKISPPHSVSIELPTS